MNILELPASERPVEKVMSMGVGSLSNSELLAVILGSGAREKSAIHLAEEIISKNADGISYLAESSAEELMEVNGVGEKKAARILCAVELGKRISASSEKIRVSVSNNSDIANLFMESMRYEKKERVKALLLNAKGEIISTEEISVGGLNSSPIHPREAFSQAVRRAACAVIFVHNHPSGNPTPSDEDIMVTKRLKEAGSILGINVLDHIIIGNGKYTSLLELGLI